MYWRHTIHKRRTLSIVLAAIALLSAALTAQMLASDTAKAATSVAWTSLGEPGFTSMITALSIDPHDRNHLLVGGEMNGISTSIDGGSTWQPALGLADGEIGSFTWHPTQTGEVWVGTMGGPYVSRDGGRSFVATRQGFPVPQAGCYAAPVDRVDFDPNDAAHLVAIGGSHRVWANACADNQSAIWESRDAGNTWTRRGQIAPGILATAGGFVARSSTNLIATTHGAGV